MQTLAPPSPAGQDLRMLGSPGNSQRVTIEGTGAWIWGASVEPGLGPTVHCSLSKHQPKARLGKHKKERSGVHHAAEGHCRESPHPSPAPGFNSGPPGS